MVVDDFAINATTPDTQGDSLSDNPIVYLTESGTNYRASSLTTCPRAFIYARQGHPTRIPPNMQVAFQFGIDNEDMVLEMLAKRGYSLESGQDEVILDLAPDLHIVGHIDAFTDRYRHVKIPASIIEVKCLNHENTEKFLNDPHGSFPYYMAQSSAYVHGAGADQVIFAIYDKDEKELKEVALIKDNLPSLADLTALVMEREAAWGNYQAADQWPVCNSKAFCPYYYLHEDEVIDNKDLEDACAVLTSIQTRLANLKALEEKVKTRIKAGLVEDGLNKGRVGAYKFSYSEYTTNRLDTKKASAILKDINRYEECVNSTATNRLEVKKVDE